MPIGLSGRKTMGPIFLKTTLLVLLVSSGFQCRRNNDNSSQNILTGKLVIFDPCGQSAIQVLTGQIDSSKVEASWTDPDNDSVYHNVFAVSDISNACSLSYYGLSKGDVFQFGLDPNPSKVVCYTCNDSNPVTVPPVSNAVKNVKKIVEKL
jgi:hypothetical protein